MSPLGSRWGTLRNDDRNRKFGDALLMREPLIDRNEGVEFIICGEVEQLPIPAACPTHLLDRAGSERVWEGRRQPYWRGIVKQHSHQAPRPVSLHGRSPRPPALSIPWSSRPGTRPVGRPLRDARSVSAQAPSCPRTRVSRPRCRGPLDHRVGHCSIPLLSVASDVPDLMLPTLRRDPETACW